MRYKLLGNSGLRVSELCLGTMTFGEDPEWGCSKEESGRILETFAEAGGNFLDTADFYAAGRSEQYLGELLGRDRDSFVLATKYTLARDPADPNATGNHRKNLVAALNASLERLGTSYVDVLWIHQWDFFTPITEVMRALDDQVRLGKVLYLGISDTPAWVIARANTLAEERGWTPFVAMQMQYSLIERSIEREYVPLGQALDVAVTAWSPLGMGLLSGKYANDGVSEGRLANPNRAASRSERGLQIAKVVGEVASELDATSAQVALAWLQARPGVVIPVVGARRESQIRENLAAVDVTLGPDQEARLDEVSAIDMGFPHTFLSAMRRSNYAMGSRLQEIDNHRASRSGLLWQ